VRRLKPYFIDLGLVFVVVVWGFSPNVFKFALSELTPLAFVFVRFVLLCIVATLARRAWRRGMARSLARLGATYRLRSFRVWYLPTLLYGRTGTLLWKV
jgi:drug/metabolite transporter (DMT)-like permease